MAVSERVIQCIKHLITENFIGTAALVSHFQACFKLYRFGVLVMMLPMLKIKIEKLKLKTELF